MTNYSINAINEKAIEKVEKYLVKNQIAYSKKDLDNGSEAYLLTTLDDKQVTALRKMRDVFVDEVYTEVTMVDGLPITNATIEEDYPYPQPVATNDEETNPLIVKIAISGVVLGIIMIALSFL